MLLCADGVGTVCLTMATLEGDEVFDVSALGTCAQVSEERVGDWDYLFFTGCKAAKAATIILRVCLLLLFTFTRKLLCK